MGAGAAPVHVPPPVMHTAQARQPVVVSPQVVPEHVARGVKRPRPATSHDQSGDLMQLQAQFGLDERCLQYVSSLPPEVQEIVVTQFRHNPGQTNASARFYAFAKRVMDGQQAQAPVQTPLQQFQGWWGVDDKCIDFLSTLSPEVQTVVIDTFSHQPGQTNVSARCFAFARSVNDRIMGGARPPQARQAVVVSPPTREWHQQQQSYAQEQQHATPASLEEFQQTWGVDGRCVEYLASLPADVQAVVLESFSHTPGQTNVSARCFGFAKSIFNKRYGGH